MSKGDVREEVEKKRKGFSLINCAVETQGRSKGERGILEKEGFCTPEVLRLVRGQKVRRGEKVREEDKRKRVLHCTRLVDSGQVKR
jgi:hypothetical protein